MRHVSRFSCIAALMVGAYIPLLPPSLLLAPVVAQMMPAQRQSVLQLTEEAAQLHQQGRPQEALSKYQQALPIAGQISWQEEEARILNQMGTVYRDMGNYPTALAHCQQALAIAQSRRDRRLEGGILREIGEVYFEWDDYANAQTYYQQALAIAREVKDRGDEGIALNNLAGVSDLRGQYVQALTLYQQALESVRQAKHRQWESHTLTNLGNLYLHLGQPARALETYQQALQIVRQVGDRRVEGILLTNIGSVHLDLRQFSQAVTVLRQALVIHRERNNRLDETATLNNLGSVYHSLGQYSQALASYQQALVIARTIKNRRGEAGMLHNIASVYRALGQDVRALEYYQQALAIEREVGGRAREGITLASIGATYLRSGKPQLAEKPLFDAVAIWESLRPGLTDENKVSLLETQTQTYRSLQETLVAQDKFETGLEVSERGRARAFAELLSQRLGQGNPETVQPITLAEIKQVAKTQNATLVEYAIIPEEVVEVGQWRTWRDAKLYIWVIDPSGQITFRQVSLLPEAGQPADPSVQVGSRGARSPDSLDQLIGQTRASLRGEVGTSPTPKPAPSAQPALAFSPNPQGLVMQNYLKHLHRLLIAPIADLLPTDPNQRVIFLPQGSLFWVPFPALLDANGHYLIEQHTVLTAPSIQVLAQTQQRRQQLSGQGDRLIVGNPTMPSYGNPPEPLPPLPGAEEEARAIAQFFGEPIMIGKHATEAAIRNRFSHANLIHLATHGLLDDQQPLNSSLALAPTAGEDGFLTASEILDLKLNADLVVLSACDTGKGKITGDGVLGLSRALIAAGTPSVIVSLWAVPDTPTAELMVAFYQHRQNRLDKAQALRQAMLQTKKNHPHPINWAAFTLIGEAQ